MEIKHNVLTLCYITLSLLSIMTVHNSAQNNETKFRFMVMGGYLFHQAPPTQNYPEVEGSGIVEAQMGNTIVLGIALEVDPKIAHLSFRADFLLFPFIYYDFLNWSGEEGDINYSISYDSGQFGGIMIQIMGNVVYKPWVAKSPYLISGIGIKNYGTGAMASTIGNALFGKSNPVFTFRLGAGLELWSHLIIELNDNISYGSFFFDIPSKQEIEEPKEMIHDIVFLVSYIF